METGKSEQVREEAWDQTPPLRCTVTWARQRSHPLSQSVSPERSGVKAMGCPVTGRGGKRTVYICKAELTVLLVFTSEARGQKEEARLMPQ